MTTVTKSFCYDPEEDPDIKAWFDNLPRHRGAISDAITAAIRDGITQETGGSIDHKLDMILDRLRVFGEIKPATSPALPDDVMAALDNLGV